MQNNFEYWFISTLMKQNQENLTQRTWAKPTWPILRLLNCVPYALTFQRVLRAYVPMCQGALCVSVLMSQRMLHAYALTCERVLRPYVFTCQLTLRAHVPMFLTCLCVNLSCVTTCLCSDFKQQKQVFNDMLYLDLKWNCMWKVLQQECL